MRAIAEGAAPPAETRPAHVDADGVVGDDYDPHLDEVDDLDGAHQHDDEVEPRRSQLGDPETDDYEVVPPLSA